MKKLFRIQSIIFTVFAFLQFSEANSNPNNVCLNVIKDTEQRLNIPKNLLLSIALTESGRKILEDFVPWPWSINTKGKGLFFKNREELYRYAKKNLKKKILNFDVGCMQINYYYHGKKFKNLYEMTNPTVNVNWAGEFLISLHNKHKNWREAISRYHSSTVWRKKKYFSKVMNNWAYVRQKDSSKVALLDNNTFQKNIVPTDDKNNLKKTQKLTNTKNPVEIKRIGETSIIKSFKEDDLSVRMTQTDNSQINILNKSEKNILTFAENKPQKKIIKNDFYSKKVIYNIKENFEDIRLTDNDNKKILNELDNFFPKKVFKISTINKFKYIDTNVVKDNLKRIEEYKKTR
tara:strand:- start:289 stop:1329 length:1041 start_codon:yes stop_codon:yes gene_type:complete